MVRAKFRCDSNKKLVDGNEVELNSVSTGSEENEKYFQYTPNGKLEMGILKPEVAEKFVPGKEYFIDISEA